MEKNQAQRILEALERIEINLQGILDILRIRLDEQKAELAARKPWTPWRNR